MKRLVLAVVAALTCVCCVQGQTIRGNYNFLEFDRKPYYFGITTAYGKSDFRVFRSEGFVVNDSIRALESVKGTIVNVGMVSNLKIGDYFDIRLLPTLSFAERNIRFKTVRDYRKPFDSRFEQVFVELPLHFRYKSMPYFDKRLFIMGGVKYGFDVAADSRSRQNNRMLRVSATDFGVEYGFGMMFYFPYFIFTPELKFTNGLSNSIMMTNAVENSLIQKALSRTITLSLHFEG